MSIDKQLAVKIIEELIKCHQHIDKAEIIARNIEDNDLQIEIRRIFASFSLSVYTDAMGTIIKMYPELDPYPSTSKEKRRSKE